MSAPVAEPADDRVRFTVAVHNAQEDQETPVAAADLSAVNGYARPGHALNDGAHQFSTSV